MTQIRYIQRHGLLTRIVHDTVAVSCVLLMLTGLFVFVPQLAAWNPDLTRIMRIAHRVIGLIFICAPIFGAVAGMSGVPPFFKKYLCKWTPEDVEFLIKFVPYMLNCKNVHMPDQDEVKSGQRIADGMLIIGGIMMAVSGVALWVGISLGISATILTVMRFAHDLFFLVMICFVCAHAFLGAGIFQPYRTTNGSNSMVNLMFGNGQVDESDALYHWGFWAREEFEDGKNIVVKDS